jgi:4-hydroxy-2-oxoglutarate aldolase
MNKLLEGIHAPVIATFSPKTGELDFTGYRANIRAHLTAGIHGIVVNGSTGEAALLSGAERNALIDVARGTVPRDRPLIVGTGAESTRTCIRITKDAAGRGADAVLVVAPHYYGPSMTERALSKHYHRIADESPAPVLLYNIPKYMHFALPASLVADLAQHPNVIGIKDSSGDRQLFASYMPAQSDTFAVLTGNAPMFLDALAMGSRGGILAASLFAPALAIDVYDSFRRGEGESARSAQARMTPLGAKIIGEFGIAGVKAAMDAVGAGLVGGPVRPPLLPLEPAQLKTVAELLRSAELVTA